MSTDARWTWLRRGIQEDRIVFVDATRVAIDGEELRLDGGRQRVGEARRVGGKWTLESESA